MQFELTGSRPSPIERVAHDGNSETHFVSGMNAQLMGAARHRHESDPRAAVLDGNSLPMRDAHLAVDRIVDLHRAILDIEPKGKLEAPPFPREFALEQRHVALAGLASMELDGKVSMGGDVPSDHHQA